MATHSYTLTHNLLVTRASFHDNRQAEWEREKRKREQNPAPFSEDEVTRENDVLSNARDKGIKELVEAG